MKSESAKLEDVKYTVDEIKAIVAHEIAHWYNMDHFKMMILTTVEFGFMFYMFSLVINNISILNSFGFREQSNFASLVIFLKIYEIVIFFTGKLKT